MSRPTNAPAKVNLYLHVTGRRADGYHLLNSLAVFADVGDVVAAAPAAHLSLRITGRFGAGLGDRADNLVLLAARALGGGRGAALSLEKNLPVASGIGGGSADAAAALRVLARLWERDLDLPRIAATLGADVPVCLGARPALMNGIGEVLAPAPRLPRLGLVLINPGVAVATPMVFKARQGPFSAAPVLPVGWDTAAAMAAELAGFSNDLQPAAIALHPEIAEVLGVLALLPGVLLARMSGSGATCFALFATPEAAAEAAAGVERAGWWCWGGGLYEPHPADL